MLRRRKCCWDIYGEKRLDSTRLFPDRCQAEVDRRQLRLCAISPLLPAASAKIQFQLTLVVVIDHRSPKWQQQQLRRRQGATVEKILFLFFFFVLFCFYNNFVHRHDAAHTLTRTIFITRFASLADGDGDADSDVDCDASSDYGDFDASCCYDATWRLFY